MSDMLNMDSLNCLSEVTEGDCKANSATATAGDSFRSIDYTEVNFCSGHCKRYRSTGPHMATVPGLTDWLLPRKGTAGRDVSAKAASKAKQRCVMGVGICLYAQLVQTKNKQCKSAIIIQ